MNTVTILLRDGRTINITKIQDSDLIEVERKFRNPFFRKVRISDSNEVPKICIRKFQVIGISAVKEKS